jgi:hypothetical protein
MSRTRTFDDRAVTELYGTHYTYSKDMVNPLDYHTWTTKVTELPQHRGDSTSGSYGSMTDVVTPNFKARSCRGDIINSPMSRTYTSLIDSVGVYNHAAVKERQVQTMNPDPGDIPLYWDGWELKCDVGGSYVLGNAASSTLYPEEPEIDVQALQELAVTRAHANISLSEVQILATIGESKETVLSLAKLFRDAVKIFRAVRRLDLAYLRKQISARELTERYMEARYAIRPLIYDVKQIHNAVTTPLRANNRQTFRGFETQYGTNSFSGVEHMRNVNFVLTISGRTTKTVEVRAGVLTQLDNVSNLSKWGVDQPIEAMWELLPFSFIVDWFFDVGQVIASWTPNIGISTKASWCVTTITVESAVQVDYCQCLIDPLVYNAKAYSQVDDVYIGRTIKSVERIVNPTRVIIPNRKIRLDALKILDLAIIGKTLFSGRPIKGYVKRS